VKKRKRGRNRIGRPEYRKKKRTNSGGDEQRGGGGGAGLRYRVGEESKSRRITEGKKKEKKLGFHSLRTVVLGVWGATGGSRWGGHLTHRGDLEERKRKM